jgi:hypothetical protein
MGPILLCLIVTPTATPAVYRHRARELAETAAHKDRRRHMLDLAATYHPDANEMSPPAPADS